MSRDYETARCHHCDWIKNIPYPSLQRKVPVAPSPEDMKAMSYALLEELKYHQNTAHGLKSTH